MPELPDSFVPDEPILPASFIPDEPAIPASFVPDLPASFVPDGPSLLERIKQLAIKAITPIPALEKAREPIEETAEPKFLPETFQPSVSRQAVRAALATTIAPLAPQVALGKAGVQLQTPVSPLDIAMTAPDVLIPAAKGLGALAGVARFTKAGKLISVSEATERLAKIAKQAANIPKPIIEVIPGSRPIEKMVNLLEREASPRLQAEQAIRGLKQTTEATRAIANDAIDHLRQGKPLPVQQGQQISEAVAVAVENGELNVMDAARILGMESATGMTPQQMANRIIQMKSEQGRALSQWSRVGKAFKDIFSKNESVQKILKEGDVEPSIWTRFWDGYRRMDNVRRALMVSQLATTVRNVISQAGRATLNVVENAMSGIEGALVGKIPASRTFDAAMEDVVSVFRAFKPAEQNEVIKLLDKFPVEQARLFRTPIGDVSIDGKVASFVNTLNTYQETFYRKAAFDARLRQTMRLKGITELSQVSTADVAEAVQHSLSLTFAANPVSGAGKAILNLYREVPVLTAIGNPFPRFWLNSTKFIYDFSPMPLFNPSTYRAMAHSDPRIAFKALNRALIGTGMIGAGYAIDQMGLTGEKWYKIKIGDDQYDLRPFAPFITTFFMGRMLSRYSKEGSDAFLKLSTDDWSQAFLSMKRTDATGIPLLDLMFSRSREEFKDKSIRLLDGFFSSFTTPFKTGLDIVGQFSEKERLPRSTRELPVIGGAIANIPFLERALPVSPSPLRALPEQREHPLRRQLTGLSSRKQTIVEVEADRLGIHPRDIYPHTGSPEFDRLIVEKMGPLVDSQIQKLMDANVYRSGIPGLSLFKFQRQAFKDMVGIYRGAAKKIVQGERPDLAIKEMIKNSDEFIREKMKELLGQ